MTKPPSIPQMANRANGGHLKMLRALRDDAMAVSANAGMGEIRGMRIVLTTLQRWGCVVDGSLTDRGRELLEHLERVRMPWGAGR